MCIRFLNDFLNLTFSQLYDLRDFLVKMMRAQELVHRGAGASAVVDTKLLSKPMAFDGRETSWRSLKIQFVAYCGANDSRFQDLLVLGETRDVAAMRNIHMDLDTDHAWCVRRVRKICWSTQATLSGLAATAGRVRDEYRRTTVCVAARGPPLWIPWRVAYSLGRVHFAGYSALSGEDVSESLKVALVQKRITDDALKTHLVPHASRHSTFQLVREEDRSVLITLQALGQGLMPARPSKGKGKGKNKDKGKAKDKPDVEMTCYYFGKVGHRKADFWGWQKEEEKEKPAGYGQEDCEGGGPRGRRPTDRPCE